MSNAEPRPFDLRFLDVAKSYGDQTVLSELNLAIPAGQKVAIIGPSGSGKTTLLRLVMTLERPDKGIIEVKGSPMSVGANAKNVSPPRRSQLRQLRGEIGMVFQHFNLFPHMSVLENIIEAPIHAMGVSKGTAEATARELLMAVGLESRERTYPHQLSGGQRQRVAIARALALRPSIMLLDEVTSALDPELIGEVLKVIRDLVAETSMTVLIVTHEMSFARRIADRVIFMEAGRIVEDSDPETIFLNPREARTKQFLRAVLNPLDGNA